MMDFFYDRILMGGGVAVPVVYHSRIKRSFSAFSAALENIVNGREI